MGQRQRPQLPIGPMQYWSKRQRRLAQLVTLTCLVAAWTSGVAEPMQAFPEELPAPAYGAQAAPEGSDRLRVFTGQLDESSETFEGVGFVNEHTFEGQAGQTVIISANANDFVPLLGLLNPQRELLNDSGFTTHNRIVITLPGTGTYTVGVPSLGEEEGGFYTLTVQPSSSPDQTLAELLNEADSLHQQVIEHYQAGRYDTAVPLGQRVLELRENVLGSTHPDVAQSLNNLAELYRVQGNYDTAEPFYQRALSTFTTLLRRKGRILDALTSTQQILRQSLSPDLAPLLDQYIEAQSQLATRLYSGLGDQDPATYRAAVDALRQQIEQLENDLSRRSTEFRVATEPVEITAVQAAIPIDAALVEIVQYRPFNPATTPSKRFGTPRCAAYSLHTSGAPQWVDLGEAAPIDEAAFAFLSATRTPDSLTQARTTGRTLDELIMQPIRPLLGEAAHILLSPDSQLNLLPFAALVDEQDRYLVETYTLTHLTTGRDLLRLQHLAPSRQPPVILADPNYDKAVPTEIAAAPRPATAPGVRAADQRSSDIANLRFGPLLGTELEANAIAPLLPNSLLLTEAAATENALKQVQAPSILHIATHGFFLKDVEFVPPALGTRGDIDIVSVTASGFGPPPSTNRPTSRENPLLRSGLALAGFNARDSSGEDGVLTALEAASLDLRGTRLVVLSACETGVGQVANGEGVYGLRRAFVIAGAESQLMSLWKVDDFGTADLMQRYYQRLLAGEGRSEALRQVQQEFIQNNQHPYYWAAFLFSGQWSPIDHL
jgi:CHAT domain-containing protein